MKNVEAYNTFGSIGSDHRVITAHLKLSLRTARTPSRRKMYDWATLRGDAELQRLYTVQVRNRYAELCTETEDVTSKYQMLIEANDEAANKLLPIKKHAKRGYFKSQTE